MVSREYIPNEHMSMVATGGSHAVTIIVVVCIGFLLFMIILGVVRIRAAHHKTSAEEQDSEMTWDDSALTITVNPMEVSTENDFEEILENSSNILNDEIFSHKKLQFFNTKIDTKS